MNQVLSPECVFIRCLREKGADVTGRGREGYKHGTETHANLYLSLYKPFLIFVQAYMPVASVELDPPFPEKELSLDGYAIGFKTLV